MKNDSAKKHGNFKVSHQRKAVVAPGSFFFPTLLFGEEIEKVVNDESGSISLKFHDQPKIDRGGLGYAPTDFIWVR